MHLVSLLFLVYVFHHVFGRSIKLPRVTEITAHLLESRRKVESVADSFIKVYSVLYVLFFYSLALFIELVASLLGSEGKEYGTVAEVVKMMMYGRNSERTHGGYVHGAVEGTYIHEKFGEQSHIVKSADKSDSSAQEDTGNVVEDLYSLVYAARLLITVVLDLFLKSVVYILGGHVDVGSELDDCVGGFESHFLLYSQRDLNIVTGKDLVTCDKSVNCRHLRHNAHVSGKDHVHGGEVLHSRSFFLSDVAFYLAYLKSVTHSVGATGTLAHYTTTYTHYGREGAEKTSVASVAEPAASLFVFFILSHTGDLT